MKTADLQTLQFIRTNAADPLFQQLVTRLNRELWERYPESQASYEPHNRVDASARVVLAVSGTAPVGCGCFRPMAETGTVEIKRMFVQPAARGAGVARRILQQLEQWAKESSYSYVRLETGPKQPEAIALYEKFAYLRTENYPPLRGFTRQHLLR